MISPSISPHVGNPWVEAESRQTAISMLTSMRHGSSWIWTSLISLLTSIAQVLAQSGQAHQSTSQHGVEVSANLCKPLPPSIRPEGLDRPMEAFVANLVRRSCEQNFYSLLQSAGRAPVKLCAAGSSLGTKYGGKA